MSWQRDPRFLLLTGFLGAALAACSADVGAFGNGSSTSDSGCAQQGQTCDVLCDDSLGCVDCLSDDDCGAGAPACVLGRCVGCSSNADCGPTSACSPSEGTCAPKCGSSADCTGAAPLCDPDTGACVGCVTDADCNEAQPLCADPLRRCSACATDADCGAVFPHCDLAGGRCAQCVVDAECDGGQLCRDSLCVSVCRSDADCADPELPRCDTVSGSCGPCADCLQCDKDEDCPVALPKCRSHQCAAN